MHSSAAHPFQLKHKSFQSLLNVPSVRVTQRTHRLKAQQQQQLAKSQPQQTDAQQAQQQHGSNPLITGLVSAMTESLRLLGVGQQQYQDIAKQPPPNPPLQPGMTKELVERLTADFRRAYFVTGLIDDSIYEPNCTFVDPTVEFSGVDLWKRNLQLLVPFLIQPRITLYSTQILQTVGHGVMDTAPKIEAEWQLATWLSLPWKPYVEIEGRTVYTLTAEANQIVRHEEFWNVGPMAALMMMFRPGPPVPGTKA